MSKGKAYHHFKENQNCPICNKIMLDPRIHNNEDAFSRDHILPRSRRPKNHFEYEGFGNSFVFKHKTFRYICVKCNSQRAAADHCFAILQIAVDHGIRDDKRTRMLCRRVENPSTEIFNVGEN